MGRFCWCGFPLARPLPFLPSAAGGPALFGDFIGTIGLSDFPWGTQELPVPVQGVSERAWGLRPRGVPLPLALAMSQIGPSASSYRVAPWSSVLSRLNTRPARTPVNASPQPSRMTAHALGPVCLSDIALRDEAKEVWPDARPQAWKNRRCIRWNPLRIFFRAEHDADGRRSFAAVEQSISDRLLATTNPRARCDAATSKRRSGRTPARRRCSRISPGRGAIGPRSVSMT